MIVEAPSRLRRTMRCSPISDYDRIRRRLRRVSLLLAAMLWPLAILTIILMLAGCTLGPTTEVRYVIVHPGQPIRILDPLSATGERLDGGGTATIDLGGWVAMPPDHWEVIARRLAGAGGSDPQQLNTSAGAGTSGTIPRQSPALPLAPHP